VHAATASRNSGQSIAAMAAPRASFDGDAAGAVADGAATGIDDAGRTGAGTAESGRGAGAGFEAPGIGASTTASAGVHKRMPISCSISR
jgi:hypothetical protein